jgi:hypothetical protein
MCRHVACEVSRRRRHFCAIGPQFWKAPQKLKWYFKLGAKHQVRDGKTHTSGLTGGRDRLLFVSGSLTCSTVAPFLF